jgi:hypothetical protein
MTFGIPKEAIPVSLVDGTMDLSWHHSLLTSIEARENKRRQELVLRKETGATPTSISLECKNDQHNTILIPRSIDVLMGRGRHPKSRPGALRMHNLVIEYREAYDSASKSGKTAITKRILQNLKNSGCRFLTSAPDGGYVECDDTAAREKIAHSFRNHRLKGGSCGENYTERNLASRKRSNKS